MAKKFITECKTPFEVEVFLFDTREEAQAYVDTSGGSVFEVDVCEGIFKTPPSYPRFVKRDGQYYDTCQPLPQSEIALMIKGAEDQARAKIYAVYDAQSFPVLLAQVKAAPADMRDDLQTQWDLLAALGEAHKGAAVSALYKRLAALPEDAKTTEFKELEKRRAEIRAQTAITIEESV